MKQLIITLLLIFCLTQNCYSLTDEHRHRIGSTSAKLMEVCAQLEVIQDDLAKLLKGNLKDQFQSESLIMILMNIKSINTLCDYSSKLVFYLLAVKEARLLTFTKFTRMQVDINKSEIEFNMKGIQIEYGDIRNKAALHLIDRAKELIRQSIKLHRMLIEDL